MKVLVRRGEKRCNKCLEWWPADTEFFYKNKAGLHQWCKACIYAERRKRRLVRGFWDDGKRGKSNGNVETQ